MSPEELINLKKTITMMAAYYRQQLDPQVIAMYAADLSDLNFSAVFRAYETWRKDPKNKFPPLPAHIREIVCGPADTSDLNKAREVAARIIGAVGKYGHTNPTEARAYIGELGWHVVTTHYSWSYFCANLGTVLNPTMIETQMRDYAISAQEQAKAGKLNQPIALPEPNEKIDPRIQALLKPKEIT